jgi:hypothetical protein
LEAEGISVVLADEATVGWFWYLGNAVGGVKLLVPRAQLEQSVAVLDNVRSARDASADPVLDDWTCDECGTRVNVDLDYCPACEAANENRSDMEGLPLTAPDATGDTADDLAISVGDEIAARALRAAVLGLLACPPVLHFYSLFLLLRLALHSGEVSATGVRKGVVALVIDAVAIISAFVILRVSGALW